MLDYRMIFEHITFKSELSLKDFMDILCKEIPLFNVKYEYENETEWYTACDVDNIEVNISRPYEENTLNEWDNSVPEGYNFGISLINSKRDFVYCELKYNENYVLAVLIPKYIKIIQKITNHEAKYHRGNYLR